MRKLVLPRDLQPNGRDWALSESEFHQKVSSELGECDKIVPMSARIVSDNTIFLMPVEGIDWEEAFAAVKEILVKY